MIKSFTVTNPSGESLVLELANPYPVGLAVGKVTGLGPEKATINMSELATMDGGVFSSARAGTRNIVFTLYMLPCPTIEDARQKTYQYFPLKKQVKLVIDTDNRKLQTTGYVESNEPDIFSSMESTTISLLCPDPLLYSTVEQEEESQNAFPNFEFPFSNESLYDPLLEMGIIEKDRRIMVNYHGDSDSGMVINLHPTGDVGKVSLYNVRTREYFKLDTNYVEKLTGSKLAVGDEIEISTVKGNKYVRLLRNGIYTNLIGAIDRGSTFFQLSPGDKLFDFSTEPKENKENLTVRFRYRDAFGGI